MSSLCKTCCACVKSDDTQLQFTFGVIEDAKNNLSGQQIMCYILMVEGTSKCYTESSWQPSPSAFLLLSLKRLRRECQITYSYIQLYSGYTASTGLERLSHSLYNRLLTFQIQIGIFEYSNKAVLSLPENFKRVCIKEKALSVQLTLLHNEN